jgi:hypothetical protein
MHRLLPFLRILVAEQVQILHDFPSKEAMPDRIEQFLASLPVSLAGAARETFHSFGETLTLDGTLVLLHSLLLLSGWWAEMSSQCHP